MSIEPALQRVKALTAHSVRLPSGGGNEAITWSIETTGAHKGTLVATVPITFLGRNMQEDPAASATFLAALASWLRSTEEWAGTECRVEVTGTAPADKGVHCHLRRSALLLKGYVELLSPWFHFSSELPLLNWAVPQGAVLNAPLHEPKVPHDQSREAVFAAHLRDPSTDEAANFSKACGLANGLQITRFEPQLPLSVFNGAVAQANQLTPGKASALDMWAKSQDQRTIHLFELKVAQNTLGTLAESLYYLLLLSHLRPGSTPVISGSGAGHTAIQAASKLIMWITADRFHPLFLTGDRSPILHSLNLALAPRGLEIRLVKHGWLGAKTPANWIAINVQP